MVAGHNLDARQQGMEIKSSKRIHVLNSIGGMAIYAAQILDVFNIQYIFNSSANTVPRQKSKRTARVHRVVVIHYRTGDLATGSKVIR